MKGKKKFLRQSQLFNNQNVEDEKFLYHAQLLYEQIKNLCINQQFHSIFNNHCECF